MPKRFRYGQKFARSEHPFSGAIWLIGLGILFYTGHIWPGILILVGLNLVLSVVWKHFAFPAAQEDTSFPIPAETPAAPLPQINVPSSPVPQPAAAVPYYSPLPDKCPRCGAPVLPADVKKKDFQHPMCAYCGSSLTTSNSGKNT